MVTKSVIESVTQSVTESTTESVTDSITESVTNLVAESVTDSVTELVIIHQRSMCLVTKLVTVLTSDRFWSFSNRFFSHYW